MNLRYALRMLLKDPGFAAVAILALALGIGADTAIFSVVDAVLLRPLPYHNPEELVIVRERTPDWPKGMSVAYLNFLDWRDQNQAFSGVAAYQGNDFNLTGMGEPEVLYAMNVSASLFPMLGVTPTLGRSFTPKEDEKGGTPVVLITHGFWDRRFGKDPNVLGRVINLDGVPSTIIGVLPPGFRFPANNTRAEIYSAIGRTGSSLENRGSHPGIQVAARLKPGVTMNTAIANLNTIAVSLQKAHPESNRDHTIYMDGMHHFIVDNVQPILLVVLGGVGFVLLIACTNVANLLLARMAKRAGEISIRTALGASRGQIVKQMLTESLLLSTLGGALGIFLAYWGVKGLIHFIPPSVPKLGEIGLDARVLSFSVAISVLTGLAFGVLPALQISRADPQDSLKEGGRRTTGDRKKQRMRDYLVVAEVALSLVLLTGAGLTIKSFYKMANTSPGLDPTSTLTMQIPLPETKYKSPEDRMNFADRVLAKVQNLPGVTHAGYITPLPLGGSDWETGVNPEGRQMRFKNDYLVTDIARISPDYFAAMGVALKKGRTFNDFDQFDSPHVAIVDELFVRKNFPNQNPIGKKILLAEDTQWLTIVGVAAHVKNYGIDAESRMETYIPLHQSRLSFFTVVVRTKGDPAAMSSAVRQQIAAVDPNQPVSNVNTMETLLANSMATKRVSMLLFSVFAGAALLLSAIGLYGVISYSVTQRTHEIGVRMALGAEAGRVLGMVLRQGALLVGIGLAIGFAAAFALGRFLEQLLFGVSPSDLETFVVVGTLLTVVALLATFIPARRAARVDPMIALRYE
jgi:putative ABC transport system permease protein